MKGNYLVTCPPDRAPTRGNTFQIRRREVVGGTDGQPQGPHPHVHILPCPYYTIHGLGGPIRPIVGARAVGMRWVGPCGRPSDVYTHLPICNVLPARGARKILSTGKFSQFAGWKG